MSRNDSQSRIHSPWNAAKDAQTRVSRSNIVNRTVACEGASVELDRKKFSKMFPNLAKELQSDENRVPVNSVRTDAQDAKRAVNIERFTDYTPDVIDFIRRCDTKEQAEEIIAYLEKRGEIDRKYAQKLREQLKEEGVRSFGGKKEENYYLMHGEK